MVWVTVVGGEGGGRGRGVERVVVGVKGGARGRGGGLCDGCTM